MSARATLLWRLAACAVSVAFVLLYTSQQRHFQDEYDRLNDKYSKLMVHSDGLAAQLQLMVDRNQRTQKLLTELKTQHETIVEANEAQRHLIMKQKQVCEDSLKKCNFLSEDDLKRHRNIKRYAIETNSVYIKDENNNVERPDLESCRSELGVLREDLNRTKTQLANITNLKDACWKRLEEVESQVDAPIEQKSYARKGGAQFDRHGPLNEELEFRRINVKPFELPELLSRKQLTERLRAKQEEKMKMNTRRSLENAAEVEEYAAVNDADYKERRDMK